VTAKATTEAHDGNVPVPESIDAEIPCRRQQKAYLRPAVAEWDSVKSLRSRRNAASPLAIAVPGNAQACANVFGVVSRRIDLHW
jgi:hypothetical protein